MELSIYKEFHRLCVFRRHCLGITVELHRVLELGQVEQLLDMDLRMVINNSNSSDQTQTPILRRSLSSCKNIQILKWGLLVPIHQTCKLVPVTRDADS